MRVRELTTTSQSSTFANTPRGLPPWHPDGTLPSTTTLSQIGLIVMVTKRWHHTHRRWSRTIGFGLVSYLGHVNCERFRYSAPCMMYHWFRKHYSSRGGGLYMQLTNRKRNSRFFFLEYPDASRWQLLMPPTTTAESVQNIHSAAKGFIIQHECQWHQFYQSY